MIMRRVFGTNALVLTILVQPVVAQDAEEPAGIADPTVAAAIEIPAIPRVLLAPIPGFGSETEYIESMSARSSALADLAQRAEHASVRIDLCLAAANTILAYQIEPSCTRRVLQLAGYENELDPAALAESIDRADVLLAQVVALIDELALGEDTPDEKVTQWRHRASTLKAFSAALRAYMIPAEEDEEGRAARLAASGLSPFREDSNRQVAAAASFWQASLRGRESDPEPALYVLDLALADPRPESMPYAFFARLLRCRLVGDRGSPATALALLWQLEERLREWFEQEAARSSAILAARIVCLQTLAKWFDRLSRENAAAERRWCAERMQAIIDDSFDDQADGGQASMVLRLSPAVPVVAGFPEGVQPGKPSTEPSADNP